VAEEIWILTLVVCLAWLTAAGWALLRHFDRNRAAADPEVTGATLDALYLQFNDKLMVLRAEMEILRTAVSEGIANVERRENRIQKTVTSARRQLASAGLEHAGLEAEAAELEQDHEPARQAEELPPVPESLVRDGPSGIPGISRAELAAMRGA